MDSIIHVLNCISFFYKVIIVTDGRKNLFCYRVQFFVVVVVVFGFFIFLLFLACFGGEGWEEGGNCSGCYLL